MEDNFVARIYTSYDSEGQFLGRDIIFVYFNVQKNNFVESTLMKLLPFHFKAFHTVLNCYVYVLAYVYSPTSTQLKSNRLMKDNPAFSMVNESDEDEDDMEDDSETGAMLRPSADRTGRNILFKLFQFSAYIEISSQRTIISL